MLTKRQKIAVSSGLLAISISLLPVIGDENRLPLLVLVIIASYFLSLWSIYGQFSFFELVSLFVLPVTLTASLGLFLSQFDISGGTRFILAMVYVVVMYTILLSENIFNVSVERNIPLVRAARTVGYLATLFVSFAFFTLLFGLGLNSIFFVLISAVVAGLLFTQAYWQIELKGTDPKKLIYFSALAGLIVGEVAAALSFWPLDPPKIGVAITAVVYVLLGIIQHHVRENLSQRTLVEYLFVAAGVVFLLIVTTSWGI
ncbi:MAG: hypothetical protein A2Z11_00930 [Candidatus Woykebacteria bacterium RBG_16_43_9]|uniref:Uncharacterized protein n=1 Tax=Candidatus Woykebacteria bacterium RBG_16_43_9 TaxID=1802596 RepID=A0A1G1WH57_9BACT|nr:MAG: hypothetical protein A2Z11_00930 [Candidatus Woykebacteria bacterium RBG_16_43_9]